ncbi:unnamed protein product [Strongylus vulgaris]|uniref:Uncharacterized protein n=1 Tax=Strongylus vulgaris TaxID=40348 RepID=A0A3P7LXT7_STRVU|nr:unnamed protein product [Strongylus vulgaris]
MHMFTNTESTTLPLCSTETVWLLQHTFYLPCSMRRTMY